MGLINTHWATAVPSQSVLPATIVILQIVVAMVCLVSVFVMNIDQMNIAYKMAQCVCSELY